MQNIQEVFDRIQKKKKKIKEIKSMYRDGLKNEPRYKALLEEIKELKEKKKQIETNVQVDMGEAYDKLEILQEDVNSDQQLLSDIAMNNFLDGKTVEVVDEYNNKYEPEFKVVLKKANLVKKEK